MNSPADTPRTQRPRQRTGKSRSYYLEYETHELAELLAKQLNCKVSFALDRLLAFLLASHSRSPFTLASAIQEYEEAMRASSPEHSAGKAGEEEAIGLAGNGHRAGRATPAR